MKKVSNSPKTKLISATITEQQYQMLQDMINAGHAFGVSEAIRQSISARHRQLFTYQRLEKEKALTEKQKYDSMTDEQYCTEILGGSIEGDVCIIKHPTNSAITSTTPLNIIKTLPPDYSPHF